MTIAREAPGTWRVTDSDAALETVLADCEARGAVRLRLKDGREFGVLATPDASVADGANAAKLKVPDFAAIRRRVGMSALSPEVEVEFFKALRGE